MGLSALAQRHHEQFSAFEDPLDLERQELLAARPNASAVRSRSSSTIARIRVRKPASVNRMNRHGRINPTLGAE
jgi:hypothetical protein